MVARGQARPTLRDVAERAGVSVSTASLVFSGKGPVAEATGERVRAAAVELGFTGPNPLAASLRQGRSGAIGVLVEGRLRMAFRDPFAIAVLDGLAEVLEAVPTGMLLIGQPRGDGESVVPQLAPLALDAVVFSLCGPGENPAVEHLAARGIPMFSTGVPSDRRITQVRIDERAAGRAIAEHVHALGHRRVAHVAMPMLSTSEAGPVPDDEVQLDEAHVPSVGRLLGFRDVFGPDAPAVQTSDGSSFEGGSTAGRALLDVPEGTRPTAVVAQSDVIAAGVIHAAEELGLRVPEDLSVTGFDGVDLPWLPHQLTTMDQHGREKGRILGTLVRRRLDGTRPRSVTQPVELRVGTTTAPPR
jgi:DNA-binding LacI/PurR family transcriptional regulator